MTSLERILNIARGEKTDRPAVGMVLSLYGAKLTGCPLEKYYTFPEAYMAGQSAVKEIIKPDLLFSPFVLAAEGEAFGSKAKFFNNQPPNIVNHSINQAEKFFNIPLPDIDSHIRLLFIRESLRKMSSKYGKEIPLVGILLGPADLPSLIMGLNLWMETLLFEQNTARAILHRTKEFFIKWGNALLSDGASFLGIPSVFTNPLIVTEEIIINLILPVYKEAFQYIKGPIILHHGGNPINPFLNHYNTLPNVAGFILDPKDDFSMAREKIDDSKILLGKIDSTLLVKQTPEEIKEISKNILLDRKNDPYFILSNSGPDIPFETPIDNLLAMREAVESV